MRKRKKEIDMSIRKAKVLLVIFLVFRRLLYI